ncbi:ATPase [Tissierella creatinini]|nr:ATPase [Tissierella creatinini]TJX69187.1 ATPase [Soehngenia saccharolytica]
MDMLDLIDEVKDVVEAGTSVPFTGKVMVDKEEILDIINEIRIKLPDEIKQAVWIKDERQRILAEAQKDADNMINEANYKLEEMVEEDQILRVANQRAEDIISRAQISAKEIRIGAMEYADTLLEETQENLKEVIQLLNDNRKELRGND